LFSATHPEKPRLVILEDPSFMDFDKAADRAKAGSAAACEAQDLKYRQEAMERNAKPLADLIDECRTTVHPKWEDEEDDVQWAFARKHFHPNNFAPDPGQKARSSYYLDSEDVFPKIPCPVLILKSSLDPKDKVKLDDATRLRHQAQMHLLPHGTLFYVEGAGHFIRRDNKELTLRLLRAWLAEQPACK
jgi:pimeloyl-ACP methyl ester carboxylesterase